jgi:glycosyltransferase involved in cell wall biosynthesis
VSVVHVIVPEGIDDPTRPSGGNTYDRRLCDELVSAGWTVQVLAVPGAWPHPDVDACLRLARALASMADGAVVLLDGLVASTQPEVLVPETGRLRLVVLVHMPLGHATPGARVVERAVLRAASAVVTTSAWTKGWLVDGYGVAADRVHVAEPGVDQADVSTGTAAGGQLLCVAAVTPGKGHDVLLAALRQLEDLTWRCLCVGSLDRHPAHAAHAVADARAGTTRDRVLFAGALVGAELDAAYADADVLVLASRGETYGMVVTEALARGIPVVATDVGGVSQSLGHAGDGTRPGLLVPPDDPCALAAALRCWLSDPSLRDRLRLAALARRETLSGWSVTAARVAEVLEAAA